MKRGFSVVSDKHRKHKDKEIILPQRATDRSAGYDICTPVQIILPPKQNVVVATDIKAFMEKDEVLIIHIRSSVGIKKKIFLTNITGVIDSDYFENEENDGNIHLALTNNGDETVVFAEGERIAQGIFMNYLPVEDVKSNSNNKRVGGIGSTNRK